jgi:hypothetical protein
MEKNMNSQVKRKNFKGLVKIIMNHMHLLLKNNSLFRKKDQTSIWMLLIVITLSTVVCDLTFEDYLNSLLKI